LFYNDLRDLKDIEEVNKSAGVKQQVIKMIQSLPEEVSIDDIMAELYFKLQVDAGLKELDEGKGIPHDEIEKRMSKWLTT
jgi:predicted transcriptional regulator